MTPAGGPVLTVDGVTTGYTRAPVLRDASVEVGDEIVALLGANGAGKTTLLRAVAGQLPVWSGTISLHGQSLGRRPTWARVHAGLAHVPEGRHVFKAMTVTENLDVAGLSAPDARRLRDEVFEIFPRLHERRDHPAGRLSGGEQQMVAVGRALMTAPRLLLVDEMSAGLAPVTAMSLVASLGRIHERGIAILLVEQSPQLIADVVDRVYVLERGRITAHGTLAEVGGLDGLASRYLGAAGAGRTGNIPTKQEVG